MKSLYMKAPSPDVFVSPRESQISVAKVPPLTPSAKVAPRRMPSQPLRHVEDAEHDAAKKRVRLKPESREQLLERLRNPQLSLHEASILLRVSRATVRRYADAGRLPCERTPGGQRRFFLRDIEMFYRQLKAKK